MAKLIDLEELKQKGLAETWPIDLNQQGVGPNFLLPGDTTPRERTYYDEGDAQLHIIFDPQTYQEKGLKKGEMVVFKGSRKKWRIMDVAGFGKKVLVSFAFA